MFGVRDPDSPKTAEALAGTPGAEATSPAAAVDGADVIVFALTQVHGRHVGFALSRE